MKRRISLYINDQLIDLEDQSVVLFNYAQTDLTNPTIVKNSFSQEITIYGTPRNNRVFGEVFRVDRRITNGFDPSRKTPFAIYNEMNEILESGYVKLNSVSRHGADVQYKVTLYGGLGSFFYALSYDENGNKKTLASLDFMGTANSDAEFDFKINAASISLAWNRLMNGGTGVSKWDYINFCPCYNGIPDKNFDAKHAICYPASVGLQSSIIVDQKTYTTKSNYCLVSLAEAASEWSIKDLRSYMQRPMISVDAILNAIAKPINNGGYTLDISEFIDASSFKYAHMWMTLPMLSELISAQQDGDLELIPEYEATTDTDIANHRIDYGTTSVPIGSEEIADFYFELMFDVASAAGTQFLYRRRTSGNLTLFTNIFLQAVAYDQNDNVVGASDVIVVASNDGKEGLSAQGIAEGQGYIPANSGNVNFVLLSDSELDDLEGDSSGVFYFGGADYQFHLQCAGRNVSYYLINLQTAKGACIESVQGYSITYHRMQSTARPYLYKSNSDLVQSDDTIYDVSSENEDTVVYRSQSSVRSNVMITKKALLSSSNTPAEYLLSFAKMFGLYFICDNATKTIKLHKRDDLFQNKVTDITHMVDRTKGISIVPMTYDSKWYDLITEGVGGSFLESYKTQYGIDYGIQRINTGYDFNVDTNKMMDSVVFKNACAILAKSKYYNIIMQSSQFLPSQFIDSGNKYTLWASDGTSLETDISVPANTAVVTYLNASHNGYDVQDAVKLELHDASNKPIDGSNVLVMYAGSKTYPRFAITDDVEAMDLLNDGIPCYFLQGGTAQGISIPVMSRYKIASSVINLSLDFGIPKEFQIPGVTYGDDCSIYYRGWKAYLADLFNKNTKVMTCYLRFNGMKVSQELLRKFYWFENSIWVLNKIKNYSMTTWDAVECEFIQVQDKDNYLIGQNYDE